jgi:hypothetical protein
MVDVRDILSIVMSHREFKVPSDDETFRYIKANYRGAYVIIRPGRAGDVWHAFALFGNQDELAADTSDELLELIRRHYGPNTEGYTDMLIGRISRKYS